MNGTFSFSDVLKFSQLHPQCSFFRTLTHDSFRLPPIRGDITLQEIFLTQNQIPEYKIYLFTFRFHFSPVYDSDQQRAFRSTLKVGAISTIAILHCTLSCADPEGGRGSGPHLPEKSQTYRVSWQKWSGSPEKSQSY